MVAACVAVARARVCVCVCVRVCVCATHRSDCARLLCVSAFFLDRAREAMRDPATHSSDCARPRRGVWRRWWWRRRRWWRWRRARVCACVCACACVALSKSSPRSSAQSRDAWHRLRPIGGEAGGGGGRGGGVGGVRGGGVCARVCVCVCVCLGRAREAACHRATHISDCARPHHARTQLVTAYCAPPRRTVIVAALCAASRHAPLRGRGGRVPNTQDWAIICAELDGSVA